ncbi:MAG: hypothetical protein JXB29_00265 [Sedimentisphaerales bacterium]|nr:hypothetical protein [Sedimentisphaerales bacterium]
MIKLPFEVQVIKDFPAKRIEFLVCTKLLRAVPGSRAVYNATWEAREVIAKVFGRRLRAKRHLKREWDGLCLLLDRGMNVPKPLFYGRTESGQYVIVIERIEDSQTALDLFQAAKTHREKFELLSILFRHLAGQHSKGVFQRDLHLGNFLIKRKQVFMLDPAQVRFYRKQVPKRRCISQLASLARYLRSEDVESLSELCRQYACARNWKFGKSDETLFRKQLTVHRKRAIKTGLKKLLRTSKRYLRIKSGKYRGVFDRGFCRGAEPVEFIKQVDPMMDSGQILKKGNTSYVSHFKWNGKDIVVKRYNHKGVWHSLRHTIKGSRARRCWLYAHWLLMLTIPTAKPLAFIECYEGPVLWKSYFFTEYVAGRTLREFLGNSNISNQERSRQIQQIEKIIHRLNAYRLTHGDLKFSNILLTDEGPVLTDLDGMRSSRLSFMHSSKDAARFAQLKDEAL